MRVAIVGGGINGVCVAWTLAEAGHEVDLYERGGFMGATSSASTKLLHGGLRYLEHGEFRLVREALAERAWWVDAAPELARPLRLLLPIYDDSQRPRWRLKLGLMLYDLLAGRANLGAHAWVPAASLLAMMPGLEQRGLGGAYAFWDGQMDDRALGLWAAARAAEAGARLHGGVAVTRVDAEGGMILAGGESRRCDRIVNVAGPWAGELLAASGIASELRLDLVRGSHVYLDRPIAHGLFLQHPADGRVFFVLPYQGRTLVGTTEVRQSGPEPCRCEDGEVDYLLDGYNAYLAPAASRDEVSGRFAGVRPLVQSAADPNRATREYELERHGRLLTVWGGKWTTARALGRRVRAEIERS